MALEVEQPRTPPSDPMTPEMFRVRRIRKETRDTYTLGLEPWNGHNTTVTFEPGQFNMIYVFGKGEVPISISGRTRDTVGLVHTVRSVGSVTEAICSLKKGDAVGVRGPFGTGWPVQAAEGCDVVVVAGGIGLAPLRPAFRHLLDHRERYGRIVLLYGARNPREMLYVAELEKWRGRFDVQVEVTVDNAGSDWHGNVGVVTTLISSAEFDPEDTVAMVCGPEIMMRYTVNELLQQRLPKNQIYVSMERNMKCAVGFCGHCQLGPHFLCKDGPVLPYSAAERFAKIREA